MSDLLKAFKVERVLLEDSRAKSISVLGYIDGTHAIIHAEKTAFNKDDLDSIVNVQDSRVDQVNDIYYKMFVKLGCDVLSSPAAKYSLIYPATQVHIKKYSLQPIRMVCETPALYEEIVLPYIQTMVGNRIQWVYNILDHKAESDQIIFEDPDPVNGYIMLPDLKWDGKTVSALYALAIVHRRDLKSLRDLRGEHVQFLRHVRDSAKKALYDRFMVEDGRLRLFIHYQPSYYHLHIHVQTCDYQASEGLAAGKAILLDDIIESLSCDAAFYQKRTMHYALGQESDLYRLMQGRITSEDL